MEEKKYLLNGLEVSAIDLILEASRLDESFSEQSLKTTKEAASIIRLHGGVVEENKVISDNGIK